MPDYGMDFKNRASRIITDLEQLSQDMKAKGDLGDQAEALDVDHAIEYVRSVGDALEVKYFSGSIITYDPDNHETYPSICQFADEVESRFGFTGGESLLFDPHGNYVAQLVKFLGPRL